MTVLRQEVKSLGFILQCRSLCVYWSSWLCIHLLLLLLSSLPKFGDQGRHRRLQCKQEHYPHKGAIERPKLDAGIVNPPKEDIQLAPAHLPTLENLRTRRKNREPGSNPRNLHPRCSRSAIRIKMVFFSSLRSRDCFSEPAWR